MLSFWPSIVLLSIVQGVLVALPARLRDPRLARLRSGRWAVIPPLSVIGFVFVTRAAENASADGLTYLALVRSLARRARARRDRTGCPRLGRAPGAAVLRDRVDRPGLAGGQVAALALSGLSCVSLGVLLAAVTPPRWLAGGIFLMAVADTALVTAHLLQRPNSALNAARPLAGLPRLQARCSVGADGLRRPLRRGGARGARGGRDGARRPAVGRAAAPRWRSCSTCCSSLEELPATVPLALTLVCRAQPASTRLQPLAGARSARPLVPPAVLLAAALP